MSLRSYTAQALVQEEIVLSAKRDSVIFFPCLFQVGFTSAPGQGGILAQREFDRRFSPHFVSTFQLVMEIALHQLCSPARWLSASLWWVGFGLHYSHLENSNTDRN